MQQLQFKPIQQPTIQQFQQYQDGVIFQSETNVYNTSYCYNGYTNYYPNQMINSNYYQCQSPITFSLNQNIQLNQLNPMNCQFNQINFQDQNALTYFNLKNSGFAYMSEEQKDERIKEWLSCDQDDCLYPIDL